MHLPCSVVMQIFHLATSRLWRFSLELPSIEESQLEAQHVFIRCHKLQSSSWFFPVLLVVYSPPARWGLLDFIRVVLLLLLLLLLHHLCLHSHVYFRLANSSPQWPLLDLNCKGLSALGTAAPQSGTFQAQWAPLDLNLGPSELSEHRWTSTWDPPSSVSTAGPQPGTLRAQ